MKTWMILAFVLCLSAAVSVQAQVPPVVNPSAVEFTPSADNDTIQNGVALVTSYAMDIATVTAPLVVVRTVDFGKPAVVNGKITPNISATIQALPVGDYVATIRAVGPGGVSTGAVSDPFTVKPRAPGAPGKPVWK